MSSISSVSSNNAWMQAQMWTRPTAAQQAKQADEAFSKIDSSGQGSFDIAGLTTAVNNALSASQNKNQTSFSSSDIQSAFSKMDSDGDGKVTKQEFTSTMSQLRGRHHHQEDESTQSTDSSSDSNGMNMQSMGGMQAMGGMPPPHPPGGSPGDQSSDEGFTADELKAQLQDIGTSDSKRSTLINKVLNDFSAADTDGNGKVSFAEAMALDKSSSSSSASATSTTATSSSTTASTSSQLASATSNSSATAEQLQQRLMRQIMKMMEAYGADSLSQSASSSTSQLSVTA
jgi:Ca2+-binding EF-hand superfamily protein